jgi:hypothetical protein
MTIYLKRNFLESALLNQTNLVAGNADFKVLREQTVGNDISAFVLGARQDDDVHVVWRPLLEFASPVLERGFGYDDQMWSEYVSVVFEVHEEGDDCLKGFAETLRAVMYDGRT